MTSVKRRLEQLEEKQWQERCGELNRYLAGRSLGDVEFFCIHGYLPEAPIPETPYIPGRPLTLEEHRRFLAGRSQDEQSFYAEHGHWPEQTQTLTESGSSAST